MNYKQEIFGLLDTYAETGTEGTYWVLYTGDFTAKDWDYQYQIIIKPDDYLKILNKYCMTEILWSGIVRYDKTFFGEWRGQDDTITPEKWVEYFTDGYFGIVIKDIEEPSIEDLYKL